MRLQTGALIHHFSKWVLLSSLFLIALLSLAGRLLLTNIEHFRTEIEHELAEYGIKGAALENLQGGWDGLHPTLTVQDASLSIPGRSEALSIHELELSVKLIPSLISGDLKLNSLHSQIKQLILVRETSGEWRLNEIPLKGRGTTEGRLGFHSFFQQLPDFVSMDIEQINILDLLNDKKYLIQHTTLNSSRKQQQLSMILNTRLPEKLGHDFELMIKGDTLKQQIFLKADRLSIPELMQLAGLENKLLDRARLSVQSWMDFEQYQLEQVINQAEITQLVLKNSDVPVQALSFSLLQKAIRNPDLFRVDTALSSIQHGLKKISDINTQLLLTQDGTRPVIWIDQLDLSTVRDVLVDTLQDESLVEKINTIQPVAELQDIVAELNRDQLSQSLVSFSFDKTKSKPYRDVPGLNGLSGNVLIDQGRAQLDVDSQWVSVLFDDLFRDPLNFKTVSARVFANFTESTLVADVPFFQVDNQDIQVKGRLLLDVKKNHKPFMSLRARYQNGKANATPRYLPVRIMPQKTVEWLDTSIRAGQISSGDLLFHGRLEKLASLQKNKSGEFHALFEVEKPDVRFLPDWPIASQGQGQASFHNTEMELSFSQVRFADIDIDQLNLRIPDLTRSKLIINANTLSSADDLLSTLSRLPVMDGFDEVKQKTQHLSGAVNSQINIEVPLSKKIKGEIEVRARASLQNVQLSIPEWLVDFQQANGEVEIHNQQVTASEISALYHGASSKLSISTDAAKKRTKFILNGDLPTSRLLQKLPAYLHEPVTGSSPWQLEVSVAQTKASKGALVEMSGRSSLVGSQLDFPAPFHKETDDVQTVSFKGSINRQQDFSFSLAVKDQYRAEGEVKLGDETEAVIKRLNISFPTAVSLKAKTGINLAGHIPLLNANEWSDFLNNFVGEENIDTEQSLQQLNSLNLTIDLLTLDGQQGQNTQLTLENNGDHLSGSMDSSLLKGHLTIPYKTTPENPLVADLDYLILKKQVSEKKLNPEINEMPNLRINSKLFQYESLVFNDLKLRTESSLNKFIIHQLDFHRDQVRLKSSGHWQLDPRSHEHVSVFNIDIRGKEFGQTVNNLGLGETIKDGVVEFNGQIGWGGELFNINWPTLIGEVDFKLEKGFLKNVDPGAGRFVGLLSFNALPKRLSLDFGDVLKEGTQFDKIKGSFKIKGEMMETSDTYMDGASAKVKIRGATNLREQTYDQTMVIIPKVGDTLPLIGTLTAGSGVGWGLLLFQKIFKKPIEKTVEIEYKVTGSWDEPVLTLVTKPETEIDSFSDSNE